MNNLRTSILIFLLAVGLQGNAQPQSASTANAPAQSSWTPLVRFGAVYPVLVYSYANAKSGSSQNSSWLGDPYGVLGIRIRASGPAEIKIAVEAENLVEPTQEVFNVPAAGEYSIYPKLRFRYASLPNIKQPVKSSATWKVQVNNGPLEERNQVLDVRSINEAPFAFVKTGRPLGNVFAAYVNEDHPGIESILKAALKHHSVRAFTGYQQGPREVQVQVKAIYDVLHRSGIRYSNITTTSNGSSDVLSQHVRFISESMNNQQANCIDGTVLMASILRKIGIEPLILLGPGHAMLGYKSESPTSSKITVVETTLIGVAPFEKAVQVGNAKFFGEWNPRHGKDPAIQIIDIAKARSAGIAPIPR